MANYNAELWERVLAHFQAGPTSVEEIYAFVKEESLRSWKNGLEAAKRRSGFSRPAQIKGTALANGRLKPVIRQE